MDKIVKGARRMRRAAAFLKNMTIHVKGSPPKTTEVTAELAIKAGYMRKKNEQGVYHRRYCALVPHTFLYYFENESSDSPRGIIDLEYYTGTVPEGGNMFYVSTSEETEAQRQYHFEAENELELNEWMAAINRDRFFTVKDERDAYMHLQEQFSSQIQQMASTTENAYRERLNLQRQIEEMKKEEADVLQQLQTLIVDMGATSTEPASSMPQAVSEIRDWLLRLKALHENQLEQQTRERLRGEREAADERALLNERVLGWQRALEASQEELLALRSKVAAFDEVKVRMAGECESAVMEKKQVEGKVAELGEQKKVLIKEVKSLRRMLKEEQNSCANVRQLNQQLATAYEKLQIDYQAKAAQSQSAGEIEETSVEPNFLPKDLLETAKACASGSEAVAGEDDNHSILITQANAEKERTMEAGNIVYRNLLTGEITTTSENLSFSGLFSSTVKSVFADMNLRRKDSSSTDEGYASQSGTPRDGNTSKGSESSTGFTDFLGNRRRAALNSLLDDDLHKGVGASPTTASNEPAAPPRPPLCRRCNGTVEGPLYSTCTCEEPLLTDAPSDTGFSMRSFLRGSSLAKLKPSIKLPTLFGDDSRSETVISIPQVVRMPSNRDDLPR